MAGQAVSPSLRLRLLGPPQVDLDGQPIKVDTRKAIALAAYLAVTAQPHRRESLAALLWPDYTAERAYANLRRTLWALNSALGPEWLEANEETIALKRGAGYWLDVEAFRGLLSDCRDHPHAPGAACAACQVTLARAVDLYEGDFLAGFSLRDSASFDDWQSFEAEELRLGLAWALERLVACLAESGDLEGALGYTRRWLALDPLHEAAHHKLMRLYAQAGHRAAALRQYEQLARILDEELGAVPAEETEALREAIQTGKLPPSVVPTPPSQPAAVPVNLPSQPTPFVGREAELAEIEALLGRDECRLLTLVGPGGAGKTRLALQAAARQAVRFRQGAHFAPLAAVGSERFLVPAIADALGFSFFGQKEQEPARQLLSYLREKEVLLLLDNFEHLLEATSFLVEMLDAAPGLKLLVTSRERLNLRGEWVYPVGGMRFPAGDELAAEEDYSAVRLFLQTARQVDINFSLSGEEAPGVHRICRLVEGMPLALELAAAWVRLLPCQAIAAEIERGLDFLASSDRDRPDRHRSLRAAFDHSWALLSGDERRAFRQLSVFRGGFDRDAAQAVAGASLPLLSALADKSLLHRQGGGRYGIHELLRQYAADHLAADADEEAATRARHGRFFLAFLHAHEEHLKGGAQRAAANEIAAEIENCRGAWRWALVGGHAAEIRQAAFSLGQFYDMRSRWREGEEAFRQAVAALEPALETDQSAGPEWLLALGLCEVLCGLFAQRLYRLDEARARFERGVAVLRPLGRGPELALAQLMAGPLDDSLEAGVWVSQILDCKAMFEAAGDRWGVALSLLNLGEFYSFQPGSLADAQRYLQASYEASREIGDELGMAYCLFDLADLAQERGDWYLAYQRYAESLAIRRELGDGWGMAYCLDCMGYLAREMGDFDEARRLHHESLDMSRQIGDQLGVAGSLDNLGLVARDEGDCGQAGELAGQALALRQEVGRAGDIIHSLQHHAELALAVGDYERARAGFEDCLDRCRSFDWHAGAALAHLGLGAVAVATGDPALARQRFQAVLQTAHPAGAMPLVLDVALGLAALLTGEGQVAQAARLLATVESHPASRAVARQRAADQLTALREQLPDEVLPPIQAVELEPAVEAALAQHPSASPPA